MKKIIGIDPGLTKTGIGIISVHNNQINFISSSTIYSKSNWDLADRLSHFYQELTKILDQYNPDIAAIEETFINVNPTSSLKLGHVRGALMLTIGLKNIKIYEYSTTAIKKSIVGVGRADKGQMQMMVKVLLPKANFKTEDEADALATAICCNNYKFNF
ncbi:MAG: crossover junction endodeoxyribonuclease RuvC [Rickettsiales bacterium]|jgi:crossover junction endodeoxyribonuclease RuvC|nr:crossover junction endodeoxyribonuclease RuvC [Rickettsiales bacterium]|tara:strand:+ start:5918 stop:6394 length:477 start_codon:yes stop_codon:yes gene_type:complete